MGALIEGAGLVKAIGGNAPQWSLFGQAYRHPWGKREERKERDERKRAAARKAAEKERIRGELSKFHARRPKGGGGPGAPIVTAGQIQQGVGQIRAGASAKEVLG